MTTPDFFRARLDAMIDLRHPLAVLANRMPWAEIESGTPHSLRRWRPLSRNQLAWRSRPSIRVVAGRKLTINRGEFRLKFDQGV